MIILKFIVGIILLLFKAIKLVIDIVWGVITIVFSPLAKIFDTSIRMSNQASWFGRKMKSGMEDICVNFLMLLINVIVLVLVVAAI